MSTVPFALKTRSGADIAPSDSSEAVYARLHKIQEDNRKPQKVTVFDPGILPSQDPHNVFFKKPRQQIKAPPNPEPQTQPQTQALTG